MRYNFTILDIWPYFIIALIFLYCFVADYKNNSQIIYLTLLVFCAFRYDVGWDYMEYVEISKSNVSDIVVSRYEPLSKLVFLISSLLNFYPFTFIFFSWAILRSVYDSINLYSSNRLISWLVFYSMPLFFFATLSTIRQSLATVIILYSFKFVNDKKYFSFSIAILIASFFHLSALLGFLILVFSRFPIKKYASIVLCVGSFFLSLFVKNFLTSDSPILAAFLVKDLQNYVALENAQTTSLQYLYYLITFFVIVFYDRLVELNKLNVVFISFTTIGIVFFNVLSFEPISATRLSTFFLIFWIYLLPYFGQVISIKYAKLFQFIMVIVFLFLSFYYLKMYISAYDNFINEKNSFLPYRFWINNL
jgi:hypothetical protein